MNGLVFNIQRFSVHDGPGIRTVVFLKGCPLRCRWCHNPESFTGVSELQYFSEKCIFCGKCGAVCENGVHRFFENMHTINFGKCLRCFKCTEVCPANILLKCGETLSVDSVLKEALADRAFYGHDGGVTFSGGEPLCQADFVVEVAKKLKESALVPTTALDTCGYASWTAFEKVLPFIDYFLYDIKAFDGDVHIKATGKPNALILENLKKLDETGKKIWIRIPVIPNVNACAEELEKIADFVAVLRSVERITLMPYHTLGREKYDTIGLEYRYDNSSAVSKEDMNTFAEIFKKRNLNIKN